MNSGTQEYGGSTSRFHTAVQPHRDFESNWAVDLAKNLEEYLLKICSGAVNGQDDAHFSINFAEAALLLQGSIQVYSRKVEYLYSLVLHALEFISQKRAHDQSESTFAQPEASSSQAAGSEDHDQFWCSDDISVEPKHSLDNAANQTPSNHFVKPPANLVVIEGDCFDSAGEIGELESYLLATSNLYRDFILLDPCDAVAVDGYLRGDTADEGQARTYGGSSRAPKTFRSPAMHSGGTVRRSSHKKKQDNAAEDVTVGCGLENQDNVSPGPGALNVPGIGIDGFDLDDNNSEPQDFNHFDVDDDDEEEDEHNPWKPLNPHESGNLKVKPFRKVHIPKRQGAAKEKTTIVDFPLAKYHGPISSELTVLWEKHDRDRRAQGSRSPFYEKLRESLIHGGHGSHENFDHPEDDNNDDDAFHEFQQPDFDMPDATYMDEDSSPPEDKYDDFAGHEDCVGGKGHQEASSQASLEELCLSHLDSLLASIAETEKQTEMEARVSNWKQKIEHNLEEQDSRPPFDIHAYGGRILDKLSVVEESKHISPFTEAVRGQQKHDVARSFSALLQLVNDGKVDLDRGMVGSDTFCYTSESPFYIRLMSRDKEVEKVQQKKSKKRPKSPDQKRSKQGQTVLCSSSFASKSTETAQSSCKLWLKLGKSGMRRCTPESKRRRRSRD